MNYTIGEDRFNKFVLDYISEEYIPDYGWLSHDEYKTEIRNFKSYEFSVNDRVLFIYYGDTKNLHIFHDINDSLTLMFGKLWIPILKKWFTDNTGLEIKKINTTIFQDGLFKVIPIH